MIKKLGNNYSFLVAPICFAFAGLTWRLVDANFEETGEQKEHIEAELQAEGVQTGEEKKGAWGYIVRLVMLRICDDLDVLNGALLSALVMGSSTLDVPPGSEGSSF